MNVDINSVSLVVVIPAYQPDDKLLKLVSEIQNSEKPVHVVVVNDGSSSDKDDIFKELNDLGVTVLYHAVNLGKGNALKFAFNYVLTNYPGVIGVVTVDADGQHLINDIFSVLSALEKNPNNLVLGCRKFMGKVPLRSKFGNELTKYVFRFFTGKALSDTQTGLRGIPINLLPSLMKIKAGGYDFEMEMLIQCCEKNVGVVEIPIETVYEENNESSHFNPLRDSFKIYFVLIRFSAVSLLTSVIDTGVFAFSILLGTSVMGSIIFSRIVASAFNFTLNRSVVFRSPGSPAIKLIKYSLLVVLLASISYVLILSMGIYFSISPVWAKIISEGALFVASFSIQKTFIFKHNSVNNSN